MLLVCVDDPGADQVSVVTIHDSRSARAALQARRDAFTAPEGFRPHIAPAEITEKATRHFAEITRGLDSGWLYFRYEDRRVSAG